MLPLALGMAGVLAKKHGSPLNPDCWWKVHDDLEKKSYKFRRMKLREREGTLFSVIDASFDILPTDQMDQFQLMAVMAPGIPTQPDMLANLWNTVRVTRDLHPSMVVGALVCRNLAFKM